jgi:hypothetical protein
MVWKRWIASGERKDYLVSTVIGHVPVKLQSVVAPYCWIDKIDGEWKEWRNGERKRRTGDLHHPPYSGFFKLRIGYKFHFSANPTFCFFFASSSLFYFSIDIHIALRTTTTITTNDERRRTNGKALLLSILFVLLLTMTNNYLLHDSSFFRL